MKYFQRFLSGPSSHLENQREEEMKQKISCNSLPTNFARHVIELEQIHEPRRVFSRPARPVNVKLNCNVVFLWPASFHRKPHNDDDGGGDDKCSLG